MQEWIHKLEEGPWYRYVRLALGVIVMVGVATWYDLSVYRNLSTREGMDAAQLARNLAEGRGYTTHFIRPFSVFLMKRHVSEARELAAAGGPVAAPDAGQAERLRQAKLLEPHPDLANAPVYPALLAGALKVMPFAYPDLTKAQSFSVYQPDLWIALFNQALFLIAVGMVFGLARKLFDEAVAWVSAAVVLGTEVFWRFSISGLSTLLLVVIFLGVVWMLAAMESAARSEPAKSPRWWTIMAVGVGLLAGLGALTRYSFALLIVPVGFAVGSLPGLNRGRVVPVTVAAFLLVTLPWAVRNYALTGTPFGTAGYEIFQGTPFFPQDQLERSLNPDLSVAEVSQVLDKALLNLKEVVQLDLPRLGGSWVSAFFLVGLLVPFRNPVLGRLRWFALGSLGVLLLAQVVGRTAGEGLRMDVDASNLLVVAGPLAFMFGVSLFFVLLDTFGIKFPPVRYSVIGGFCLLASASLWLALLTPSRERLVFYPPWVQDRAQLVAEQDLIMSDIPWAVAWYGQRDSLWLSLKYREDAQRSLRNDFYASFEAVRPIRALYLSFQALKAVETQPLWDWALREGEEGWEKFVQDWEGFILVGAFLHREVPSGFPLKRAPRGLLPELFLTDSERGAEN
jgi:hypothetical protein